jgi:hypothetical protein
MNDMNSFGFPSMTIQHSARTSLVLEDDKKIVVIDHPIYGQLRFLLPTKEEITNEYCYSKSSKKKWINSFMIFRIYLQRSKNWVGLSEVSKIASDAWADANKEVQDACNELQSELERNFLKNPRYVPYSHPNPKKPKKKTSKKKQAENPVYPSPTPTSIIVTPEIHPDLPSPSIYTPASGKTSPMYEIRAQMSSLTLPPAFSSPSLPENPVYPSPTNTPPTTIIVTPEIHPDLPSPSIYTPASGQTSSMYETGAQMSSLTLPPAFSSSPQEHLALPPAFSSSSLQEQEIFTLMLSDQNQLSSDSIRPLTPLQVFDASFLESVTSSTPYPLINSGLTSFFPIDLNTTVETIPTQINEIATESEIIPMEMQHPLISSALPIQLEEKEECINYGTGYATQ